MRKINAKFNAAFISEAGSYLTNNDYYACAEMDDFACYVIADGIDEDMDYKSAEVAVTSIIRQFTLNPSIKKGDIEGWMTEANRELLNHNRLMRLKASITVVVTDYINVVYGQAGNTRLLLFRQGVLLHANPDHSLSAAYLENGKISADKVASHIERHNLSVYLGQPGSFRPFVSGRIKLADGDTILLFTRGIWENIDNGEITDSVTDAKLPQDILDSVEEMLLSKQPPNLDNYTLTAIFVDKIYDDPRPPQRKALLKKLFFASIPILIILLIFAIVYYIRQERKNDALETMAGHIATARVLTNENNYARATEEYKAALDIARKYKLANEQKDLGNYFKTAELIVSADSAFQQKDFVSASKKYQLATDASYFADYLGADYINRQQNIANNYMQFTELLETGEQHVEEKEYKDARKNYLEARSIAAKIYFIEGRKQVSEKLNELNVATTEENKELREAEAAVYEKQGDNLLLFGQHEEAMSQLKLAAAIYSQVKSSDKLKAVESKIASLMTEMNAAQKSADQRSLAVEAAGYEQEGDYLNPSDLDGALGKYGLALQIYNDVGKKERVPIVQAKIDSVNERKRNQEKFTLQQKALEIEREGDMEAAKYEIEAAKRSYAYAQQLYATAGLSANVDIVQKKLDELAKSLTEFEMRKIKADNYVAEADVKTKQGDYVPAHYNYLLAKDIYKSLNLKNEEKMVNERIKTLKKLAGKKL